MVNYRHGDLCLIGVEEADVPNDIEKSDSSIIMKGSHRHDHSFKHGMFYPCSKDRFVFGFFKADDGCVLFHPEHGELIEENELREVKIEPSWYECRKQFEDTNEGMRPVID